MEEFDLPSTDTISIIYQTKYKLSGSGLTTFILSGEDISGNLITPDTNQISVVYIEKIAGGMIQSPDSKLTLVLPSNSLPQDMYVTVAEDKALGILYKAEKEPIGSIYNIGPIGISTSTLVTLAIKFTGDGDELGIYRLEGDRWVYVGGRVEGNSIVCEVNKLGTYQVQRGTQTNEEPIPTVFSIISITPNPFNYNTFIRYSIPRRSLVTIKVYDAAGRVVNALIDDKEMDAGYGTLEWKGKDRRGCSVSQGVYFRKLEADGKEIDSQKIIRIGR